MASASLTGLIVIAFGNPAIAADQTYKFDIPAEPLGQALVDFSKQSSQGIVFLEEETSGKTTAGLHGQFAIADALRALLADTDMTVDVNSAGVVLVRQRDFEKLGNCAMWNASRAHTLLTGVSAAALSLCSSLAWAQDNTEAVTVTGSRVITDAANSPTPLTVLSVDDARATTPTTLADALDKLPQFMGSGTPHNASANGLGQVYSNSLNLRNLGQNRSLVLLDGHRVAPTDVNGNTDIDILPQSLIQRVDIVTGGASAVYGSDAVSGVVNYILDKNFTGAKFDFTTGISTYGDAAEYRANATVGTALFGGRGHIEASARLFHQDRLPISARPLANNGRAWVLTGSGTAANPFTYTQYAREVPASNGGTITCSNCAANNMFFAADGVLSPFNPGTPTGTGGINSGGDGAYRLYGTNSASQLNKDAFLRVSYDLTDNVTAYVQGSIADARYVSNLGARGFTGTLSTDNAYLSPQLRTLVANPSGTFQFSRYINAPGDAGEDASSYGTHLENLDRNTSVTAGLNGVAWAKFDWSAYYTHSQGRGTYRVPDNLDVAKLSASIDVVTNSSGQAVCRVSTTQYANLYPGCVPMNVFGPTSVTRATWDYISKMTSTTGVNTVDDLGGSVSGNVLDLSAGPVKAALSFEARWNRQNTTANQDVNARLDCTGLRFCNSNSALTANNALFSEYQAHNNVYEVALETLVPVIRDAPLIQSFDINLAGRFTNYSSSGSVKTWKAGFDYHINDSLRLRGTASFDIRAPDLNSLYAPKFANPVTFPDVLLNQNYIVPFVMGGNPNLKPEEAHTYTAGTVFTPSFLTNFTASIDYFNIKIDKGITTVAVNTAAVQQLCYGSGPSYDSPYCNLMQRPIPLGQPGFNSPTNRATEVSQTVQNTASIQTEGWDAEVNYRFNMESLFAGAPGSVSLRALATYQPYLETFGYPGAAPTLTAMPKGRATFFIDYTAGSWAFHLQDTWFSKIDKRTLAAQVWDPAWAFSPSYNRIDLAIDKTVQIDDARMNFYLSVSNVLNTLPPPYILNQNSPGLQYPRHPYFGDVTGRYFALGVKFNL